ncbi:MAG: hypothetical protein M3N18_02235 [Actinomycetota bacterium]|nr:hypothetical protein [Actinomycetota bacterium]
MTAVMEREPPAMMPTIVRRVGREGIQLLERTIEGTPDGDVKALCVFWSLEHARRDMYANGCYPEDGWKAIERDAEELALVFDVLSQLEGETPVFVYIEPAPGMPDVWALLRPEEFFEMLEECRREEDADV